ncbi:MAG: alanine--tRNA ligase [bacterium]
MNWDHKNIRSTFLKYFESNGHKVLPSYSLIPDNDPSLLFVAAGMVPFKAEFSGKVKPKYNRISTCQKCFRMDDIDNVGYTLRHHTFFEMLGNFSFGDYFKYESIHYAWDLLTNVYKLDPNKLWVSVHISDDEAEKIWENIVNKNKIVRLEDNFWGPAGLTGPCGPSTEIFYENFYCPNTNCKPGSECQECEKKERFIEIWNIVFTQYFKNEKGELIDLPQKNIDTGMGLERLARILQNKTNQYHTDLFYPIITKIQQFIERDIEKVYNSFNIEFNLNEYLSKKDVYLNIVADHLRGAVFLISDGVIPSNDGRGYVLRKLIRRAILYSKFLGILKEFSHEIVDSVIEIFKDVYPEVYYRADFSRKVLNSEEKAFIRNISKGIQYFNQITQELLKNNVKIIDGKKAFYLYDTLGFPLELTLELAKNNKLEVNIDEFYKELENQKIKSRKDKNDIKVFSINKQFNTEFVGYDRLKEEAEIIAILKINPDKSLILVNEISYDDILLKDNIVLITNVTPFYPEAGGQVGDKGIIFNDNFKFEVKDTQKHVEGFIFHVGKLLNGYLRLGDRVNMEVDFYKRKLTAIHHTATHLLHSALRKVLGAHAYQAGSLVDYDRLRFDFTHFQSLTDNELKNIEDLVNEKILKELDVLIEYKPLNVALQEGAIALFTEKYPENVRTVKIIDENFISYELCAGTHVKNTSTIGLFKILSEKGLQLGVRRIEAVSNLSLLPIFNKFYSVISDLSNLTNTEIDKIKDYVLKMINDSKNLKQNIFNLKKKYYQFIIEHLKTNNFVNIDLLNEEDLLIAHDLIKIKNPNYFGIYHVENSNKIIFIFNSEDKELTNVFNNYNLKLINLGNFKKVIINNKDILKEISSKLNQRITID